jgi:uncharacterized protein (DUF2336 family)
LARDKSVAGRKALTATVSDLFFARGDVLSDRERSLMSEILRQLVHDVEVSVRRDLAERLAARNDAPRELVSALARDEIEVAHPILLHSSVLHDAELIEIVHHRTLEHQLAIAMRKSVSEAVSDALVEEGHVDVIKTLLENPNALISAGTLDYLVEQSKRVDSYQNPLLSRPELTPELAQRMYWWVSAALRKHIVENFPIDAAALDETMERAVTGLVDRSVGGDGANKSLALAERLAANREITPQLLVQTLRQGEIALFEALFAKFTGIRLTLVWRLLFEPGGEGLAVACRAVDVPTPHFASLFLLSRKARPSNRIIAPGEVARLIEFYDRIKIDAARQLVTRWQRDQKFLQAVWQVDQKKTENG